MGFEPTTPSLGSWYSTTELRPHLSLAENKEKELYLSKLYHVKLYCSHTIRFKSPYIRDNVGYGGMYFEP